MKLRFYRDKTEEERKEKKRKENMVMEQAQLLFYSTKFHEIDRNNREASFERYSLKGSID